MTVMQHMVSQAANWRGAAAQFAGRLKLARDRLVAGIAAAGMTALAYAQTNDAECAKQTFVFGAAAVFLGCKILRLVRQDTTLTLG